MEDAISKIRGLSQDRHHCEDAHGLFGILEEIEGLCDSISEVLDEPGDDLDIP